MAQEPFNLFIYGTLMNPTVFRAVLGRRLAFTPEDMDDEACLAEDAVLDGHNKISPDNTYQYAVPDPHGRIRGYVIRGLPPQCMATLRKYEGRNYRRRKLKVHTRADSVAAICFIANVDELQRGFGYGFQDPFKQEVILGDKIEAALLETERRKLHTEAKLPRRAMQELYGATIRDLVRHHFEAGGISDYAIHQTLMETPLGDFAEITADPEAKALAPNYLALVVRQVIFNQFESRVRSDFRYELDHMQADERFYGQTISSLAALRMLNGNPELLDLLVADCLAHLSFERDRLMDYVGCAILAADDVYDARAARRQLDFMRNHMGSGYIPLGAELEFSNIGHDVIRDATGRTVRDRRFDGFLYFSQFALDALTWKLGGHVDDHEEKVSSRKRRGFFEVALGSLSIAQGLSKPLTDDPWLLNQIIQQARQFYDITPHSVHISLQLRHQHRPARDRLLPLHILKCLFAIAGDPAVEADGKLRIRRLSAREIITWHPPPGARAEAPVPMQRDGGPLGQVPHLLFSEISRRHSKGDQQYELIRDPQSQGRYVQQYRFLRLSEQLNYEPIVLALKGLQVSLRPGTFLTPAQAMKSRKHRRRLDDLLAWAHDARPIGRAETDDFLQHIHAGLLTEARGKPAHGEAYIAWGLSEIRDALNAFERTAAGRWAASGRERNAPR